MNFKEVLQFFPTAEGYVKATPVGNANPDLPPTGYAYNYTFNYTDHLGNVRVSYTKDPQTGNLKILDESHYYPFGLKHQEYQANGFTTNPIQGVIIAPVANNPFKYKYNSKEFQDELNLNLYDYGARNYDPAIGRWVNMDPLADQRASMTPYNYVSNNPVVRIDPTGMLDDWYQSEAGDYVYDKDITSQKDLTDAGIDGTYLGESYSINVTNNKTGDTIGSVSLNSDGSATYTTTDGNIMEFNDMTLDMGFDSEHLIKSGTWQESGSYFDAGSFILNTAATSSTYYGAYDANKMYSQGMRRGTNGNYQLKGRNLRLFGNAPPSKNTMPISKWSKMGRFGGYGLFGVGVAMDGYGVMNGTTSAGKMGLNTTMGTIGLYGGPIGVAVSGIYFGVDAFYPGGWTGALNNSGNLLEQNQAIHGVGFNLYKDW